MNDTFTILAYSENHIGLLNRITAIFGRRNINIETLTVSQSAIKGVHKFTIVINTSKEFVEKVVLQIEKQVEVLKAYYYTDDEVIFQEIALYKVSSKIFSNGIQIEQLVRKYNAKILEVNNDYTVIEKTGHKKETQELFEELNEHGVLQFVRSGRIAITRRKEELLSAYLEEVDKIQK